MSDAATYVGPMAAIVAFVVAVAIIVPIILAPLALPQRIALAKPNARSSHTVPTPQGGGIAVIAATIIAAAGAAFLVRVSGFRFGLVVAPRCSRNRHCCGRCRRRYSSDRRGAPPSSSGVLCGSCGLCFAE